VRCQFNECICVYTNANYVNTKELYIMYYFIRSSTCKTFQRDKQISMAASDGQFKKWLVLAFATLGNHSEIPASSPHFEVSCDFFDRSPEHSFRLPTLFVRLHRQRLIVPPHLHCAYKSFVELKVIGAREV
jgi:hypothetical protein